MRTFYRSHAAKRMGRWYFGIGIRRDIFRDGLELFCHIFKIIGNPPAGEVPLRGRDYVGFRLSRPLSMPEVGFDI